MFSRVRQWVRALFKVVRTEVMNDRVWRANELRKRDLHEGREALDSYLHLVS